MKIPLLGTLLQITHGGQNNQAKGKLIICQNNVKYRSIQIKLISIKTQGC